MYYHAVVHHDPGSAYGVSFPDISDCFAAADEEADIVTNAIAALDDYFADGHRPPEPKGIGQVVAEFAEDLAEGAYIISVPFIPRPTKLVRLNISMDQSLLQAIDASAKRLGLNRSAFLSQAALNEITERA